MASVNDSTPSPTSANIAATSTDKLNDLIETLKDGQLGFAAAAEDARSADIKQVLTKYARQREDFARQLQRVVAHHGGNPEKSGSLSGALHRGWINMKAAVATRDDLAVLKECERGEDLEVSAYQKALEEGDLGCAASLISKQYADLKAAHDEIRGLRDRYETDSAAG